jgi:nitroreductase
MEFFSKENLIAAMNWRYATKMFDPTIMIDKETLQALLDTLVLTPSSYGLQPWKFIIVQNPTMRKNLREASWNQAQVEDCSHMVVFAIKETLDIAHVEHYLSRMAQVRGLELQTFDGLKKMLIGDLISGPRSKVITEWAARQAYIALGNLMTACAVLGVDACPLEGINPVKYDEILGLEGSGFKTVVACPIGYRKASDKYALAKKVRFTNDEVIQFIK